MHISDDPKRRYNFEKETRKFLSLKRANKRLEITLIFRNGGFFVIFSSFLFPLVFLKKSEKNIVKKEGK